jgi:hypothetical protein
MQKRRPRLSRRQPERNKSNPVFNRPIAAAANPEKAGVGGSIPSLATI